MKWSDNDSAENTFSELDDELARGGGMAVVIMGCGVVGALARLIVIVWALALR